MSENKEYRNKRAEEVMTAGVSVAILEACIETSKILEVNERKLVTTFMTEFNKIMDDKDALMIKAQAFLLRTVEEREKFKKENEE